MQAKTTLKPFVRFGVIGLALIAVFATFNIGHAAPTFTGNAPADFGAVTTGDVASAADPGGTGDVGVPVSAPPGTVSGWDFTDIYFDYDHATDTMYVGIDCNGICGDADGDGDPAATSAWLSANGGQDVANMGGSESFSLMLDGDNNATCPAATGNFETVTGVSGSVPNTDITNSFGMYDFSAGSPFVPSLTYGAAVPPGPTVTLFANPSAAQPDLEFSISNFSTTPGFTFTPGSGFTFQAYLMAGSLDDDGIGEDFLPSTACGVEIFIPPAAALGDFVWFDTNQDGIQDVGEAGVPGVTINLYDCTTDALVGTDVTDASGLYGFPLLDAGCYYLELIPPAGYAISPIDQGQNDCTDADFDPTTGLTIDKLLDAGETDLCWDAGIYQVASIGDYVWLDADQDGIQDAGEVGVPGVTVTLFDCGPTPGQVGQVLTDANGFYSFTNLPPGCYFIETVPPPGYTYTTQNVGADDCVDSDIDPATNQAAQTTLVGGENDPCWDAGLFIPPASIGDLVWFDTDQDGIQDTGEAGVGGVTVQLYDCQNNLIATDITDGSGIYGFTNLIPACYYLDFAPPAGYVVSPQDVGADDCVDSDINATTGQTAQTTLISGENDLCWDAGIFQTVQPSIGDLVWNDSNRNGIQDPGEPGVAGVTVGLFDCAGNQIALTTTDSNGNYLFTGLSASCYYVIVWPPSGWAISPRDAGGNDCADSDVDPATGQAAQTTLGAAEVDLCWDAGLFQTAQPTATPPLPPVLPPTGGGAPPTNPIWWMVGLLVAVIGALGTAMYFGIQRRAH